MKNFGMKNLEGERRSFRRTVTVNHGEIIELIQISAGELGMCLLGDQKQCFWILSIKRRSICLLVDESFRELL